jgi:hypothetical protein
LSAAEGRRFAFTVGAAFLALAGISAWRARPRQALVLGTLGGLLVLAGVIVPSKLGPVIRAWTGLAHLMSKVTTPVFMGIVYFVVLTPVGLLMRVFGRRPLERSPALTSWWIARAPDARQRADMERQF